MALHDKVMAALRASLEDVVDVLEDLPGGRLSGIVISKSFEGLDHQRRQDRLGTILKKDLTPAELRRIGAIAVLTPKEANVKAL